MATIKIPRDCAKAAQTYLETIRSTEREDKIVPVLN
jgi:hypothetical protein